MEAASNVLSDMSSITKESAAKSTLTANSLMQLLVFANPAILDIRSVLMVAELPQI